jgi:hypothetical protein
LSDQEGEKTASVTPVQGIKRSGQHGWERELNLRDSLVGGLRANFD